MIGKGIPSKALKITKTYDDYFKMLEAPYKNWIEFQRIRCKRQQLMHYAQCKKGLGCYNNKVFQDSSWCSTPLGHSRNNEDAKQPEEGPTSSSAALNHPRNLKAV